MSYLIARHCDGVGCIAFRTPHGPSLVALKKDDRDNWIWPCGADYD